MLSISTKSTVLSTAEVAGQAGIHKDTLLRWLRAGLVAEPQRDRRGWRYFTPAEAQAIVNFAQTSPEPPSPAAQAQVHEPRPSYPGHLARIDWDFTDSKTNYLTHGLHPYPAKFIPQIPNALIQELSSVGDTVADIFCGSGTTLVEALLLKRHAVGIDANPLACLISQAKTLAIPPADADALTDLAHRMKALSDTLALTGENDLFARPVFVSSHWRPNFAKLDFWFDHRVIEELAEALAECRNLASEPARQLALTAFSSIVVAVSRQDSDTRYVRREKNIPPGEVLRRFSRAVETAIKAAIDFSELAESRFQCQIFQASLLDFPNIPPVDLVVCSPPYPNAYSYHLYHMTRMIWLGMDQPRFKREEIGSHRKYSSHGKNGATVETFKSEFSSILAWLSGKLKRNGYACFIVGDSTLKGQSINNANLISEIGQSVGFREVTRIERVIQSTKKAFNPAIGMIKKEKILILENGGNSA